jgi:L-lactate utilization protein LutC
MKPGRELADGVKSLLTSLRGAARRTFVPRLGPGDIPEQRYRDAVWQVTPGEVDLVAHFVESVGKTGARGFDLRDGDPAERIVTLLSEHGVSSAYIPPPDWSPTPKWWDELEPLLRERAIRTRRYADSDELFDVAAAVTVMPAAIAETGSVAWHASARTPRLATLAPPVHVAVVPQDRIMPDMADYFAWLAQRGIGTSNATLITGPSKTADIEGTLITGVHGPGKVEIVIV